MSCSLFPVKTKLAVLAGWFFFLGAGWLDAQLDAEDGLDRQPPAAVPVEEESKVPEEAGDGIEQVTTFEGFTVVGSHQRVRGGIASLAGKLGGELAEMTGNKGRQLKLPIIIYLYGQEGDREQKRSLVREIEQIQGKTFLKLHLHLAKGVDHQRLRYHVMELLLYERGLCDGQRVAEGEDVLVRPWLVVGMLEALDLKYGRANRKIYQAGVPYFEILPLQQVFESTETEWKALDGRRPLAFRAISGAMVSALFRQPDGRRGMEGYLSDVATFKGEEENLMRKHFPSMNKSKNSLEKWVDLEMAELGTATVSQIYSLLETEKRLESILKLRYRDENEASVTLGMDGYREILSLEPEDRRAAVAGASAELERISYRCFPNYRPLIAEYEIILREIVLGKDKDIQMRLNKLADVRMKYQEAGTRVRDYLDWYYITQADEVSGSFKQYIDLSRALKRESIKPRESDSIQEYLDGIQALYVGSRPGTGMK
ncbi:hypothetical protein HW115_16205 [Verrucomicrobiaceae bacterium N1E253]|uniref:Uncharacterized protein n=1 Tax=Oceaniferula marina TaxID=2748318 RepID=A0A851GII5_9BACT|nr:hypothetical protein [Oceaniferula marina]NWK57166.1 hypothetical protein [Oceaniferula marina]